MAETLFTKYGGFGPVRQVVTLFYQRLLACEAVAHFFDGVDMESMIEHQTKFVSYLLGGPVEVSEERMARAHTRLGIGHSDFDEMGRVLDGTLADAGFEDGDRAAVMAAIEARRHAIVSRSVTRTARIA